MTRMIRSYTELNRIDGFEKRFDYLSVKSRVGIETFCYERWLNQDFYTSTQWRHIRNQIIVRDCGRDLGVEGYEIFDKVIVHHMNSIDVSDITKANADILNPEYLICTSHRTHNAIH